MEYRQSSLESMVNAAAFRGVYKDKIVFLTGHSGFKGSWLSEWLLVLGAKVIGCSLAPITKPSLFEQLELASRLQHIELDIRDSAKLAQVVSRYEPDFIFHLAAQAIVRESYSAPVDTYTTNVIGTINVLEAARKLTKPCIVICVTTDKCYENHERNYGYREEDNLGGYDPYSSSKAAAEIAIASWRRSFFKGHDVKIASVRAGNVIGGGDWAADRIMPDSIRCLSKRETILVRNPKAVRPWQHVLEPLGGYLALAEAIENATRQQDHTRLEFLCSAFNFGPSMGGNRTVSDLVDEVLKNWPGKWVDGSRIGGAHEAFLLRLNTNKARRLLSWKSVWGFKETVARTVDWYKRFPGLHESNPQEVINFTRAQLAAYVESALDAELPWTLKDPK